MKRSALLVIFLAACSTAPKTVEAWQRTDGKPLDMRDLEIRQIECRGEVAKALAPLQAGIVAAPDAGGVIAGSAMVQRTRIAVRDACMIRFGYIVVADPSTVAR